MASPSRNNGDLRLADPADPIELTKPIEEGSQQSRRRPKNAEILGETANSYPPTLGEVERWDHGPKGFFLKFIDAYQALFPDAWWDGQSLLEMVGQDLFSLPLLQPDAASHHVYIVTSPHYGIFGSFFHWSIYSQGHFYHLSAPNLGSCLAASSDHDGRDGSRQKVVLKHEDLHHPDTADYIRLSRAEKKKVLVASQVGQTDYSPNEIVALAKWVIDQMNPYDLFKYNCQAFVISMMRRTVMRRKDCSVFVGTAAQIADWDVRARKDANHKNCVEHGYFLCPPKLDKQTSQPLKPFKNIFKGRKYVTVITAARRICIAYEKGPRALGAYRAPTLREELLETWRELSDDVRESWRIQMQIQQHLISDLAAGHWRNAFYGRVEDKRKVRQRYGLLEREAAEGNSFARFYLRLLHLNILGDPAARGVITKSSNALDLSVPRDE